MVAGNRSRVVAPRTSATDVEPLGRRPVTPSVYHRTVARNCLIWCTLIMPPIGRAERAAVPERSRCAEGLWITRGTEISVPGPSELTFLPLVVTTPATRQ